MPVMEEKGGDGEKRRRTGAAVGQAWQCILRAGGRADGTVWARKEDDEGWVAAEERVKEKRVRR